MEISENSDFCVFKKTPNLNAFKSLTNLYLIFIDEACDNEEQVEQRILL